MLNFKMEIAEAISKVIDLSSEELVQSIEIPKEKEQGDYAFPCFKLAKVLKKSPQIIADEINASLKFPEGLIEKTEVIRRLLKFLCR